VNAAARLALAEAALARLADQRSPKVSAELKLARQRTLAGEVVPPALHTVEELERRARGRGLFAELAKAQLRMIRAEAGAVTAYGRQDAVVGDGTVNPAPDEPTRSTGLQGAVALVDRIDQLVGRYA
jgi:hypothetical protein